MMISGFSRRLSLGVAAIAVVGMGFTAGCSSKQAPAPTEQTVESKRAGSGNADNSRAGSGNAGNSHAPKVKAPSAKTVNPAQEPAPGQPGRDSN